MVEPENIPPPAREEIEKIGTADLVIGVLVDNPRLDGLMAAHAREAIARLDPRVRAVLIQSSAPAEPKPDDALRILPYPLLSFETSSESVQSFSANYHAVFAVAGNLNAHGCAVIASDLEHVTPDWIYRLTQPLIELDFDLVSPAYSHRKFEGLLTVRIVPPLTRSLIV